MPPISSISTDDLSRIGVKIGQQLQLLIQPNRALVPISPDEVLEVLPPSPPSSNPALDAMGAVVANVMLGTPVQDKLPDINRLVHGVDSRANLISTLAAVHGFQRYHKLLQIQQQIEDGLLEVAKKPMSASELLELASFVQTSVNGAKRQIDDQTTGIQDLDSLLTKIDYALDAKQREAHQQLANTTPQNREIMRRLAHRMLKLAKPTA